MSWKSPEVLPSTVNKLKLYLSSVSNIAFTTLYIYLMYNNFWTFLRLLSRSTDHCCKVMISQLPNLMAFIILHTLYSLCNIYSAPLLKHSPPMPFVPLHHAGSFISLLLLHWFPPQFPLSTTCQMWALSKVLPQAFSSCFCIFPLNKGDLLPGCPWLSPWRILSICLSSLNPFSKLQSCIRQFPSWIRINLRKHSSLSNPTPRWHMGKNLW